MTRVEKKKIILDALHNFPTLPIRTVARYILAEYGPYFDGDLEKIRHAIRYYTGKDGETNRQNNKEIVKRAPAEMPKTWRNIRTPHVLAPGKWLVLADIHVPYHEPLAIQAAVEYGKKVGITNVLLNGDIQDCASVSHWPKTTKRNFDKELVVFLEFLDWLCAELPVPMVYKPGNHEYWLPRYYASKAPELIGLPLLAMESVLNLESRGVEFIEYKQIVDAGGLPILHGDELRFSSPVNPARGLFLKTHSWAMCSHFHQTAENSTRDINGKLLTTWSTGCLCDLSPDYSPYSNWNHGFAVVDVTKGGGFKVDNRRILPSFEVV